MEVETTRKVNWCSLGGYFWVFLFSDFRSLSFLLGFWSGLGVCHFFVIIIFLAFWGCNRGMEMELEGGGGRGFGIKYIISLF